MKVRVSFYSGGKEKAFVVFDGSGSNLRSWFTQKRVIESSYTDISNTSANKFSVDGYV